MTATPPNTDDRRKATRYTTFKLVGLIGSSRSGTGTVHDVSATGARIEYPTFSAPIDSTLRLQLPFTSSNDTVRCRVARRTESGGFCVRFEAPEARTLSRFFGELPR